MPKKAIPTIAAKRRRNFGTSFMIELHAAVLICGTARVKDIEPQVVPIIG